jgi:hypothetical protein
MYSLTLSAPAKIKSGEKNKKGLDKLSAMWYTTVKITFGLKA